MEEAMTARYWCHMCTRMVNPILEADIKCPYCESGFIEEMSSTMRATQDSDGDFGSDRGLSLWAPIFLNMMGNTRRRRRFRHLGFEDEDDDTEEGESRHGGDTELDREIESIIHRRRRSSATILRLLRDARAGIASESENPDTARDRDGDRDRHRERERVILINPFNQTIVFQGSSDYSSHNSNLIGSLGDYFVGPGFDLLLQHLAENNPNGHGTPPARKEAIEAMPTVKMTENVQCSVCLDDLQIGVEAKEMPCKHKFHSGCILPWLELHSSCPVCRFQLPIEESKTDTDGSGNGNNAGERERERERERDRDRERERERERERDRERERERERERDRERERESERAQGSVEQGEGNQRNENGRRFSLPWPFSFFSSHSGSHSGGGNSSSLPKGSSSNECGDASF